MRNPVFFLFLFFFFAICEQHRRRSACVSAQSDQRLYCSLPIDSIISLVSIVLYSCLWLASVAEHVGMCLTWSQTPDDRVSRDVAHLVRSPLNKKWTKTAPKKGIA